MRRAPRPRWPIALFTICLALGLFVHPGPPDPPPHPTRTVPTIEPLPPLSLDLQFSDRQEWGGGGTAVMRAEIVAGAAVEELILDLDLPEGLTLGGAEVLRSRQGLLRAGERRVRLLPVMASRDGEFAVRLEAEVRLVDGRTFRLGQGATLRVGMPRTEGRLRNGAYEVRGVPLGEMQR